MRLYFRMPTTYISKLPTNWTHFVATVCGSHLKAVASKYADDVYLREVKKAINKKNKNIKVKE